MTQTIDLILVRETEAAWGVKEDEDAELIWLPKSRVERGRRRGTSGLDTIWEFEVPEWIAIEKGLA